MTLEEYMLQHLQITIKRKRLRKAGIRIVRDSQQFFYREAILMDTANWIRTK